MREILLRMATQRPLLVYLLVALLSVLLGLQFPRIQIDTDPENMLSADQPQRVFHNQVEERFELHDALVVGLVNEQHSQGIYNPHSLRQLHQLSNQILAMDGVIHADLMSLAAVDNIGQDGPGTIRFEWMMKDAPVTQAQADNIKDKVSRLPLLVNTLVSGDGKAAAIYVPLENKHLSYPIAKKIRALTENSAPDNQFYIAGLPVAEDTFGHEMFVQMGISAPLAGLMIFALMWWFFRNIRLIIAPMIVAMATVIITMGLLIGSGFTVHIMSSMIPIFLMPIAVVDSVHILSEFADLYQPGDDPKRVIKRVVRHLFKPMLFTSITSAVGFASLLLTPIPPVQVFGAFVAIGILLAFLLTIVFIPAYIVRMQPAHLANLQRLQSGADANSLLARSVKRIGRFAFGRPRALALLMLGLLLVSALGVMRIEINDNPVRWFKEQHSIRIADKVLNQHFAGTYDAFLVLQHEAPDLQQELASIESAYSETFKRQPTIQRAWEKLPQRPKAADFDELILALDDQLFTATGQTDDLEALLQQLEVVQAAQRFFQQPSALEHMQRLQAALVQSPLVGKTSALPDAVKVVTRELRSGRAEDYRIPPSAAAVAQTLLQYQSSHRPHDLWHMVTPDYDAAAIWLQLSGGDNQDMSEVIALTERHLEQNPLPPGVSARWAGKTYINVVWQQAMVNGMLRSLLGAFLVVFVMMSLLFRSLRYGLLAMVPLTLTILGAYGLIGWLGKDYDMPIAVLSSLSLGLSVDFAIHFIQRMRDLRAEGAEFNQAAVQMFAEPARAISRNAIVIGLGFVPLFFAPLMPYVTVGTFMVLIMLFSGLATLLFLPALLRLLTQNAA